MPSFRILVVSDLHMHLGKPGDAKAPSYLSARPEYRSPKSNPIEGILPLFEKDKTEIDWLVCGGDIGDKADAVAAATAWQQLESVKRRLHIRKLIGTVGNHDVDSRREAEHQQPDQGLKHFQPGFPVSSTTQSERYWARDYLVTKDRTANATLALVNTCGLHGVAVKDGTDPEHNRGYVTQDVLDGLAQELPNKLSRFNVLVMHHHIRQHPWVPDDTTHAVNGPALLEVLKSTNTHWLVIHGHQHMPDLSYGDASPFAPVVLSAGSLSATALYPVKGRTPRNQLYLIDFDTAGAAPQRARVYAWNWSPSVGWIQAGVDSGLPRLTGFGQRGGLPQLLNSVIAAIDAAPAARRTWEELVAQVAEVQYLLRQDLDELIRLLRQEGIAVYFDQWQCPAVFERA
jgi:predicted phosphodiesterase